MSGKLTDCRVDAGLGPTRARALLGAAVAAALLAASPAQAAGFVVSVQYLEITLGTSDLSKTADLTKGQTISNCVPFATATGDSSANGFGNVYTDVYFTAGSPPKVTVERSLTGGTVTVGVYVVEFDSAQVRVRQGSFSILTGSAGPASDNLGVTVDLARSALVFYTRNTMPNGGNGYDDISIEGIFNSTTQVRFARNSIEEDINGHYFVFEALNVSGSYAFSVQPRTFSFSASSGTTAITSVAEQLVGAAGRGAIAAFSPSGMSLHAAARGYHEALVRELLSGAHERLGDAVLAAQVEYARSGVLPELLDVYHLFGDPALRLR